MIRKCNLSSSIIGKMILILCLFFLGIQVQYGQDYVNILRLYGQFAPNTDYDEMEGNTDLQEMGLRFRVPIPLKNNTILLPGLFVENVQGKLAPSHSEMVSVYTITPQLGIQLKLSESWKGNYLLMPSLYSDLKEIDADDFQLGAIILIEKTKAENLNYSFGMYVNTEVYGLNLLPLAGFYYINEAKTWEVDALMPVLLDINYRLSNKLRFGFHYLARGTTHYLNDYNGDDSGYYLEKGSKDFFLYVETPVMKDWAFQAMIGHSIGRYYEVYDADEKIDWSLGPVLFGDERTQINGDVTDGLMMKFKLVYRYPLE